MKTEIWDQNKNPSLEYLHLIMKVFELEPLKTSDS